MKFSTLFLALLIFLSACNSMTLVPTPTATLTPTLEPATVIALPTATPVTSNGTITVPGIGEITSTPAFGTPTSSITETVIPAATGIEITTPVDEAALIELTKHNEQLPTIDKDYFASQAFAEQVMKWDAAGMFDGVITKDMVPFTKVSLPIHDWSKRWEPGGDTAGFHPQYILTYDVVEKGTYFGDPAAFPGALAAAYRLQDGGYGVLMVYKNPDKTHGFQEFIVPSANISATGKPWSLHDLIVINADFQSRTGIMVPVRATDPVGMENIFIGKPFGYPGDPHNPLAPWLYNLQLANVKNDSAFYTELSKNGKFDNLIDGQVYIPVSAVIGDFIDPSYQKNGWYH